MYNQKSRLSSPTFTIAMLARLILAVVIAASLNPGLSVAQTPRPMDLESAVGFVRSHCLECHEGSEPEAGLDLSRFDAVNDVVGRIKTWNGIADRVALGQMPPAEMEAPSPDTRSAFVAWIKSTIHEAVCDDGVSPGSPVLRRLNRTEYANTVRDLLGIHVNAGHALPADGAGGEGFDNAAETLFLSPILTEKYLDAAKEALGHALNDPESRQRIVPVVPNEQRSPREAAGDVLAKFLPLAFRRPVTTEEIEQYVALFQAAYDEDDSYLTAIRFSLQAAMVSPKFLFLWEEPCVAGEPVLLSQYELASRLSYFMWASMPDAELFRLAADGKLHDEAILAEQVVRMLRSPIDRRGLRRGAKVRGFATSFVEQWLGTRSLGREFKPDVSVARDYDSELEGGMKYEPILFFEDLLADNRTLLNLIDSDFTYLNRRLAKHYRIRGEFREQPKRVELEEKARRGGLLGMSAVLAVSSLPHRTSPVLRGKWILETMLGTPPPPPPADVAELDETTGEQTPMTLRERLEKHRADTACASCHATMDPLGFGLENYDVLGRWRSEIDGIEIDARGTLPGDVTFEGPDELKRLLLERKDQFIVHLVSKTLGFALGRGLTHEDACVVEAIGETLAKDDYRAQTLVYEIVRSIPFRYKKQSHDAEIPSAVAASEGDERE